MRCLVVDDDEKWRRVLSEELSSLGFECFFAKSDTEAIREIKRAEKLGSPFRFITLDRRMEETGDSAGVRVLSFLKSYLGSKQGRTVCVVISGTSSDSDVRDYFKRYGVCDFISKADPEIWEKLKQLAANLVESENAIAIQDQMRREHLIGLRETLITRFDEGELRTLCFDLGVDYDSLRGLGKADKARELVAYCERYERVAELVVAGKRLRPDVAWSEVSEERPGTL